MATIQVKQYSPSSSLNEINEQNQQIAIAEEEEEEEGEEDEESDEDEVCPSQNLKVGRVNLVKCKGSHVGNKSIYHGAVKVHNFLRIGVPTNATEVQQQPLSANVLNTPSSGFLTGPFSPTGSAKPFQYKPIGERTFQGENSIPSGLARASTSESSDRPSDVNNELLESSENNDMRSSTTDYTPSGCDSDQEALISDNNEAKRRKLIIFTTGIAVLSIFLIVLVFILVWYYETSTADIDILPMNFTARLTPRGVWFAFPPKKPLPPFKYNPIPFVIVSHTASMTCTTKHSCRTAVRNIQAGQMETTFNDISYNYLVGGDGYIYEGRGWNASSGGNPTVDCAGLSVAFIGNFIVDKPPLKQVDAFKLILNEGVKLRKLKAKYGMFMEKQIKRTESPGEALIEILELWPHWEPFSTEDLICNKTIS